MTRAVTELGLGLYLISGGWIRFWTIAIMTAAIVILNLAAPSMP